MVLHCRSRDIWLEITRHETKGIGDTIKGLGYWVFVSSIEGESS